jgi:hypothetical protein
MARRAREHVHTLHGRDGQGENYTFVVYRLGPKTYEVYMSKGLQSESKLMHPSAIGKGLGRIKAEIITLFWLSDFVFEERDA